MYAKVPDKLNFRTQVIDLVMFGHLVFNEDLLNLSLHSHGATKGFKAFMELLEPIKTAWNHKKILEEVVRFNDYWKIKFSPSDTPSKMLEEIENQFIYLRKLNGLHLITSRNSVIFQMAAMMTMIENSKGSSISQTNLNNVDCFKI